jgi:hypothetical protein
MHTSSAHGNVSIVFSNKYECKHYQFTTETVYYSILEIFSFGPCEQRGKTIKGTKTFLKTLENDARVHMALIKVRFS